MEHEAWAKAWAKIIFTDGILIRCLLAKNNEDSSDLDVYCKGHADLFTFNTNDTQSCQYLIWHVTHAWHKFLISSNINQNPLAYLVCQLQMSAVMVKNESFWRVVSNIMHALYWCLAKNQWSNFLWNMIHPGGLHSLFVKFVPIRVQIIVTVQHLLWIWRIWFALRSKYCWKTLVHLARSYSYWQ